MNKRTRQRRVAIVKDAINQILSSKIMPDNWGYCSIPNSVQSLFNSSDDLKPILNSPIKNVCRVCALGSLLIADVSKNNKCSVSQAQSYDFYSIYNRLSNIFDIKILEVLEYLFENGQCGTLLDQLEVTDGPPERYSSKEIDIYNIYMLKLPKDPKDRLLVLLRNIVRNNGELIIPRDIVRLYEKRIKKEMANCT